jgi:hypothetical protein
VINSAARSLPIASYVSNYASSTLKALRYCALPKMGVVLVVELDCLFAQAISRRIVFRSTNGRLARLDPAQAGLQHLWPRFADFRSYGGCRFSDQ